MCGNIEEVRSSFKKKNALCDRVIISISTRWLHETVVYRVWSIELLSQKGNLALLEKKESPLKAPPPISLGLSLKVEFVLEFLREKTTNIKLTNPWIISIQQKYSLEILC